MKNASFVKLFKEYGITLQEWIAELIKEDVTLNNMEEIRMGPEIGGDLQIIDKVNQL